uniref:Uncharacterized protein n=1 Tax=Nicotiana tabacum TaxID=4097 RepID=A0A1S4CU57_TOBAC
STSAGKCLLKEIRQFLFTNATVCVFQQSLLPVFFSPSVDFWIESPRCSSSVYLQFVFHLLQFRFCVTRYAEDQALAELAKVNSGECTASPVSSSSNKAGFICSITVRFVSSGNNKAGLLPNQSKHVLFFFPLNASDPAIHSVPYLTVMNDHKMAETGRRPGRSQLYLDTYKKQDGTYVNEVAKEICPRDAASGSLSPMGARRTSDGSNPSDNN